MIYKICLKAEWDDARTAGIYPGSADDHRDGYIHFSAAAQTAATAAKYFRGQPDLVLIAVDAGRLGSALRWEPSRGGELFPHLYGPLPVSAAVRVMPLPLSTDGTPLIPVDLA